MLFVCISFGPGFEYNSSADSVVVADPTIASAVESKTVKLGMSTDEVKKSLGNPDKIVDLGAKQVYIYKDMKVYSWTARCLTFSRPLVGVSVFQALFNISGPSLRTLPKGLLAGVMCILSDSYGRSRSRGG
jgi:hypothetical protein